MRIVSTEAVSYQSKTPDKCLEIAEREKKSKYLHTCINERRHFNPFVNSVNRLIRVEAEVMFKRITSRLASKQKELHSRICEYVKSKLVITLVRATHRCILGDRVTES